MWSQGEVSLLGLQTEHLGGKKNPPEDRGQADPSLGRVALPSWQVW